MKKKRIGIVTITGPSGAGKTSIIRRLLELRPEFKLVVSNTTRDGRPSDLPGEYKCNVPAETFLGSAKFLWVVEAHGNHYGTLLESADEALFAPTVSFMILVPNVLDLLRKYAEKKGRRLNVLSFYILSPQETELRRRMELRGEKDFDIEKRISDCRKWDEEAKNSSIPYTFISNNEPEFGIEKATREILTLLE